jgi:Domain of unknown function (DUF397)
MDQDLAGSARAVPGTADGPSHGRAGGADAGLSAAVWRKSTASQANGSCVEVAYLPGRQVAIRDSKNTTGPVLRLSHENWQELLDAIRENRLLIS